MCLTDVSDFQSQFSTKILFLACSYFQIFEKNSGQTWVMLNISNNTPFADHLGEKEIHFREV